MRQLMISLDKNILNKNSPAAQRMIAYGKDGELFILLPHDKQRAFSLSPLVHVRATGGNKGRQFFRLLRTGKKIVRQEKCASITTQDPFMTGLAGWWLKVRCRVPLEVQVHGDFYGGDYYKKSGWKHGLYYYLGKWVLRRADTARAVGERVRRSLIALGIDASRVTVRPVSIDQAARSADTARIDLRERYPGYKKIYLALGRLDPVKNIGWLIDVFKKIPADTLLLIVGDGTERKKLEQQALGLPNVRLEPWTNDSWSYIKTASVVLFPSLSEGYGLVPMEAAAAGTPIIMNDVGVANFELKAGEKVKIIPISNKQAWIEAIIKA